jgi:hypothetical protein
MMLRLEQFTEVGDGGALLLKRMLNTERGEAGVRVRRAARGPKKTPAASIGF